MAKDRRTQELAAIHAQRRNLGLDDDTYRDLLWTVARVRSARDLDAAGRAQVLDHLRSRGGGRTHRGEPKRGGPREGQVAKIEALLADAGRPWAYAHGLARRMFGVQRVEWCGSRQLRDLIAALEYDAQRRMLRHRIDQLLAQLGHDRGYIDALLAEHGIELGRRRWDTHPDLMQRICQWLDEALEKGANDG